MYKLKLFNKAFNYIESTMEHEVGGKHHFLHVGIKRISDGKLQRHVYHENT